MDKNNLKPNVRILVSQKNGKNARECSVFLHDFILPKNQKIRNGKMPTVRSEWRSSGKKLKNLLHTKYVRGLVAGILFHFDRIGRASFCSVANVVLKDIRDFNAVCVVIQLVERKALVVVIKDVRSRGATSTASNTSVFIYPCSHRGFTSRCEVVRPLS